MIFGVFSLVTLNLFSALLKSFFHTLSLSVLSIIKLLQPDNLTSSSALFSETLITLKYLPNVLFAVESRSFYKYVDLPVCCCEHLR